MEGTEKVMSKKIGSTTEKMTKYRWVILGLIFVIYTIANADRSNIGIAMPFMRKEIAMTNTQAGGIASLFFLGYAGMMIPAGFIVTKYGVRRIFTFAMIATSCFTGMAGFVTTISMLQAARLFTGIAEGPVAVGCSTTINNWFPGREKGTASGIFIASSKFGPLIVPTLCAFIIQTWGWRYIFYGFAIPGIVLAIAWYFMVHNHPSESPYCSTAEAEYITTDKTVVQGKEKNKKTYTLWWLDRIIRAKKVERLNTTAKVFLNWNMIGAAIGYFFMVGIVSVMMSWIPTYLTTVKHLAIMKMAIVASAPFAGTVAGNMAGGWFSDNVLNKRRKPLMIVTAISTSIMMYSLIYAPANPTLLAGLLFLTGLLLALGYSAFMAYPMALVEKEKFPIGTAIINTGGQLGGFAAPLAVGMILDKYNWNMVFTALAIGSIITLLIVLTIIEPVDDPLTGPVKN